MKKRWSKSIVVPLLALFLVTGCNMNNDNDPVEDEPLDDPTNEQQEQDLNENNNKDNNDNNDNNDNLDRNDDKDLPNEGEDNTNPDNDTP